MFVGRQAELDRLEELYGTRKFQMVVVYGRRRVGKTTLVSKFAKGKRALFFTALDQGDQNNLADFSAAIQNFFGLSGMQGSFASWAAAFDFLAQRAAEKSFVFIFDEFPYAAQKSKALPSVLQVAVDHAFKNTGMFLILCGSNQGFMESEVLGRRSPLFGRRTAQMKISPLNYLDARKLLPDVGAQDAFRYYGCFGGVPYYLTLIDPARGFRENLARLYFDPSGFLFEEPFGLLRQELAEPAMYNSILRAIAGGANRPHLMADRTGIAQTSLPRYLKTLVELGIIERVVPFGENPESSKRAIYQMMDACYDFWFRFVMPSISDIEGGLGSVVADSLKEGRIDEYLRGRFERLCLEWLKLEAARRELPIPATTVGSWWGTDPAKKMQTDIDVLAADRAGKRLLIGECKYRENFDESAVLESLQSKRELVKGYRVVAQYVFSKHEVSQATQEKAGRIFRFVTLDGMYEGEN